MDTADIVPANCVRKDVSIEKSKFLFDLQHQIVAWMEAGVQLTEDSLVMLYHPVTRPQGVNNLLRLGYHWPGYKSRLTMFG